MGFPSLKVSARGGADFTPVPAGVHYAICIQVIDLGVQKQSWQGQEKNKRQVYIRFELPDEVISYTKGGKEVTGPSTIGRTFTLSIDDKSNLGPFLEGWRGKTFTDAEKEGGFEITSIIGKVCQIGVVHEAKNGKTYANITTALPLSKAQQSAIQADKGVATPKNELLVYSTDSHDEDTFAKLPDWLRTKIGDRVRGSTVAAPAGIDDFNDSLDDIPF